MVDHPWNGQSSLLVDDLVTFFVLPHHRQMAGVPAVEPPDNFVRSTVQHALYGKSLLSSLTRSGCIFFSEYLAAIVLYHVLTLRMLIPSRNCILMASEITS